MTLPRVSRLQLGNTSSGKGSKQVKLDGSDWRQFSEAGLSVAGG
jgi:hypothetical protein